MACNDIRVSLITVQKTERSMNRVIWLSILGLGSLLVTTPAAWAQARRTAYIAYVYPAGGQQGTTFQIRLGGQRLNGVHDVRVSGTGVSAKVVEYYRQLSNQEVTLLREQLRELRPRRMRRMPRQRPQQIRKRWT